MSEFDDIARLFRPLTFGAPEALGLLDDAAVIPSRPGFDLVVTKDAIVEGVHFPVGEAPELVARKLARVNLSDLAAKGARPYGCFLAVAFPARWDPGMRAAFAGGLGEDLQRFGLALFGGDTVSTPGPFTASLTALGWVEAGRMVRRGGAAAGDLLLVSGPIGDGTLGLKAAHGEIDSPYLAGRYRLPEPRLDLAERVGVLASAAADVSDGLIADAGHIAAASGVGLELALEAVPLSPAARAWLDGQPDAEAALIGLAAGGDDYQIVCTAPPDRARALETAGFTVIGRATAEPGMRVRLHGRPLEVARGGWSHG
ncbi:MAG: thiL [Marmoricola sp.]|nr:thiL [Marmoricola sp.]